MPDSKEIYLVAGGSGFLGRHIVEALKARGDKVSAFDIVQRYDDTPFYTGDVSEPASIVSAIKQSGATCLFHTVSPIPNSGDDSLYHRVNVEGTRNIIDAAVSCNVRKLIFTSSAGVVFEGRDIADADEQTPYPQTAFDIYTQTKAEAEKLVIAANGKHGLLTVTLRPASIYGPGDRQSFPGFLNAYKRQQTHFQIGSNTNLFDWTYVDNLVHAHLLAADQLTSGSGVAGEIFFITNGDPIPFWDFPRMIWSRLAAAGIEPVPTKKPFVMPKFLGMVVGFIMEYIAYFTGKEATFTRFRVTFCCATRWHNINKARRVLGYRPLITNEDGVERMVNWWLAQQAKAT